MKSKKKSKKKKIYLFDIFNYIGFFLYAFVCFYPLYYVMINAISDPELVAAGLVQWFPKGITFVTLKQMFGLPDIVDAAVVTIARVVLATSLSVAVSAIVSYVFSKDGLKHKKFWYRYFILTGYIGGGLIPNYLNLMNMGMLDSFFWIYIACGLAPANLIITKTFMENLPRELEEAAYIDGAGFLKRFFHIALPLSKPVLATTAVFMAVANWNDYMTSLIYMPKGKYHTLQTVLFIYNSKVNELAELMKTGAASKEALNAVTGPSLRYALTAVIMIPIMVFYPFFQKYFAKGLMMGAVKG